MLPACALSILACFEISTDCVTLVDDDSDVEFQHRYILRSLAAKHAGLIPSIQQIYIYIFIYIYIVIIHLEYNIIIDLYYNSKCYMEYID